MYAGRWGWVGVRRSSGGKRQPTVPEKKKKERKKEIDSQEVQEVLGVPKKLDSRKHPLRHIIITLPKTKEKERILEAAREKETVTYKGVPIRLVS